MKRVSALAIAFAVTALAGPRAQEGMIEWPYVGGDQHHAKFSTASQVTPENVDQLEVVWTWDPQEMPLPEYGTRPGSFETTPLMIDNVLYLSTMYTRVVALDAETGRELWAFRPARLRDRHGGRQPRRLQAPRRRRPWRGRRHARLHQQPRQPARARRADRRSHPGLRSGRAGFR